MVLTRPTDELPDKAPLGFLNPWLYSDEVLSVNGLNDIEGGSIPGLCSIGHGSRDAKLSKAAVHPQKKRISPPSSCSGANAVMTTRRHLDLSYVPAIQNSKFARQAGCHPAAAASALLHRNDTHLGNVGFDLSSYDDQGACIHTGHDTYCQCCQCGSIHDLFTLPQSFLFYLLLSIRACSVHESLSWRLACCWYFPPGRPPQPVAIAICRPSPEQCFLSR